LTGVDVWCNLDAMSRLQLALNVDDLEQSIAFYSRLFGTDPAKVKPGYANFAVDEPALKLVLIENPGHGGSLNHLGVEVPDTDTVDTEQRRLAESGLASVDERDTTCCYARQDKFWVEDAPDGEHWEVYTVLEDAQVYGTVDPADHTMGSDAADAGSCGAPCCV
jgi:catechol 2,3-dioxygenase-like lactoylglutathione lyase family enzyme